MPPVGTHILSPTHGRIGTWAQDRRGRLCADKGRLSRTRHQYRAFGAGWGTDVAVVEQLAPDECVTFLVAPDGVRYWATRAEHEAHAIRVDHGGGAQWVLPDRHWHRAPAPPADAGEAG